MRTSTLSASISGGARGQAQLPAPDQTVHGTKKDAQRELTKLLRERELGSVAKTRVRERTHRDYVWLLKKYIRPSLGERRLDQLKALELQKLYGELSAQGLSPRTVRYAHTVLRNALEQAVKWGMIARNPADLVQLPCKQGREMSAFSPEEAQRFLAAARDDPWFAVFSLLLDTGLRPGEALALKWSDVDLMARQLTVRRTLTRSGWHFAEPKTAGSRRNVPFTSPLQRVLVAHQDTQNTNPHSLVFVGEGGEPLHANNLSRRNLPRILKRAGLPDSFLRPAPHLRNADASRRGPPKGRERAPRARERQDHARHLLARAPHHAARGDRTARHSALPGDTGGARVQLGFLNTNLVKSVFVQYITLVHES